MVDIITTIVALKSDAVVNVSGNTLEEQLNGIVWLDSNPTNITNEQIAAKQIELQAEYDALAYARAREIAYPNWKGLAEAYTEKEIGEDSTKWDAYVTKYNLVRNNNPKP